MQEPCLMALSCRGNYGKYTRMSGKEVIEQIKALPVEERAKVAKFIVEQDDSWIPDDFKAAMEDAQQGRLVDMDKALNETPPPHLR